MGKLVSVIVPVYNAEKYLEQCVRSVLEQDYRELELILVNDGSSDESLRLCRMFEQQDSRVVVIDKPNGGAAESRNVGLERSTGKWILFLDSDDYYRATDVVSKMLKSAAADCDVVCMNYQRYFEDEGRFSPLLCPQDGLTNERDGLVSRMIYTSSACLKLIRADILRERGLRFRTDEIAEDIGFCAKLLRLTERMTYCPDAVYVYRDRAGSKSNSIKKEYITDALRILERISVEGREDTTYMAYVAFQYCTLLINRNFVKTDAATVRQIRNFRWLLKYDSIPQVRLVHAASRILGVSLTSRLLYIYFRMFG
ncbi:MAG: glycosyltransferase family 2 protein [Oscillospiraceae bacterium]|nr:glycosyltransferase family 2 protein [Oscillospiraceae bacterium]